MNAKLFKLFSAVICVLCFNELYAQGGGPPMLTDDPATLAVKKWEINTSINAQVTHDEVQLSAPYIDANYGISNRIQVKLEFPFLVTIDHSKNTTAGFSDPLFGIKYHFLDESKNFVSIGTYPQATLTGRQKNFLVPLLMAKTFGRFVIGEELGCWFIQQSPNVFINGNLVSYRPSARLELMAEYFIQKEFNPSNSVQGFMNYGCRYTINKTVTFICSLGTQLATPDNEQRQTFFSFIGIQSDL